jgi:hypothetical protein
MQTNEHPSSATPTEKKHPRRFANNKPIRSTDFIRHYKQQQIYGSLCDLSPPTSLTA